MIKFKSKKVKIKITGIGKSSERRSEFGIETDEDIEIISHANGVSAFLTRIKFPTGLESVYTGEKYTDEGVNLYRVRTRKDVMGGKSYNEKSYSYSVSVFSKYTDRYTVKVHDGVRGDTEYGYIYGAGDFTVKREKEEIKYEYSALVAGYPCPSRVTRKKDGRETVEEYRYDGKNVSKYWGPESKMGINETNNEISMTYSAKTGILKGKYTQTGKSDYVIKEENKLTEGEESVKERVISRTVKNVGYVAEKVTRYEYDEHGDVTEIKEYKDGKGTDEREAVKTRIERVYDSGLNCTVKTTKGGITVTDRYNVYGERLSETDGNGNETAYTLNKYGDITKITYADGGEVRREYDYKNNTLRETDENGNTMEYKYDGIGNLVSVTDKSGKREIESRVYDGGYRLKERKEGNKIKNVFGYDKDDRKISVDVYDISLSKTIYSERNVYTGNERGLMMENKILGGNDGTEEITSYERSDLADRIVERSDRGVKTNYEYDRAGRVTREIRGGLTVNYEYDARGNMIKQRDSMGAEYINEYDGLGRKKAETDASGNKTEYYYDDLNRLIEKKTPFDKETGEMSAVKYKYDKNGNVTEERLKVKKDNEGGGERVIRNEYDKRNRLVKSAVVDNNGKEEYTQYEYDRAGNRTKVKTGNGTRETKYEYDTLNRLRKITYPSGKSETYEYNAEGSLAVKTDRNGVRTEYGYNALGEVTEEKAVKDGKNYIRKAEYGATGAKIKESNENMSVRYEYNDKGLMSKQSYKIKDVEHRISYMYDDRGNCQYLWYQTYGLKAREGENYTDDIYEMWTYQYDDKDRLTMVRNFLELYTEYEYDKNGNLIRERGENDTWTEYEYNAGNMIVSVENRQGGYDLSRFDYTYSPDGNVRSVSAEYSGLKYIDWEMESDDTGTRRSLTEYEYDSHGRVSREKYESGTDGESGTGEHIEKTYGYDVYGNRTGMGVSGRETGKGGITGSRLTTYKYDSDNRLTEERDSAGSLIRYEYDGNGNQIKKTFEGAGVSDGNGSYEPNGTLTLGIYETAESKYKTEERKYDGFNQLTEVKGAANVRYGYRPDGLRLSKDAGNEHTDYIWNGSQIMAEVKNGAVERTRVYSYGLRRTKSTVWGQPEAYYVYNAHGDVVQLTGPVGYENYDPDADNYVSKNLLKTYEYDAFGDEMGKEDSDTNPFRYCGEYYDAETESIYLRARDYDPGMGRFTSEDPARDGLNWYAYCENNPVMFNDPTGKATWFIHGTWSDSSTWTEDFKNYYKNEIFPGEAVEAHNWSGDLSDSSRRKYANLFSKDLIKFAKEHTDEPIRLVGHSHGGNVAILVANELAKQGIQVDTLITIATPAREYELNNSVSERIQLYTEEDYVQKLGGECLIADRIFDDAINIEVPEEEFQTSEEKGPIDSHSAMHSNIRIWEKYLKQQLRIFKVNKMLNNLAY